MASDHRRQYSVLFSFVPNLSYSSIFHYKFLYQWNCTSLRKPIIFLHYIVWIRIMPWQVSLGLQNAIFFQELHIPNKVVYLCEYFSNPLEPYFNVHIPLAYYCEPQNKFYNIPFNSSPFFSFYMESGYINTSLTREQREREREGERDYRPVPS
jgi:hypothetical protein